jgi:ATP-dependent DNA ligase
MPPLPVQDERMPQPVDHTIEPMLAKAVASVPTSAPGGGALLYEPKWDGFRGIVAYDGRGVEIGSRGGKSLTRYFPELVEGLAAALPGPCVLDGEIVVPTGTPGAQRLDWETLSQRIHPAASRIAKLAVATPASFIAFDLLAEGGRSLLETPFGERRASLTDLLPAPNAPLFVSQVTDDPAVAERWLAEFEGAGLDGVVAKPVAATYAPGKRTMLKVKHHRSADVIATGYRIHASGHGVGSLLLSLYDAEGVLRQVGGVSAFTTKARDELIDELAPLVARDAQGAPVRGQGERNRFSSSKDTSFVVLRPERVLEVRYDQMEGDRFRHTVQLERWRPDREARSCTFEQLEVPHAYDLGEVLA